MLSFLKSSGPRVEQISPADAVARASKGEVVLIDVRELAELRSTGKAKNALHIPLSMIPLKADLRQPDHAKGLSADKPVVVYCASGGRSGMAGQALLKLGYTQVYNLGGLGDWRAGGGAVVPA
ncbi:MAG: rhodanese-like domain-containing protein [Paracoccaceae bacterium]